MIEAKESSANEPLPKLPQWWNERIDAAWRRARTAAIRDWKVRPDRSSSLDASIEEHALAFGHGARMALRHHVTWEAVSPQLRADWAQLGNVGPASWENVAHIIRHEWVRAGGPGGDAAPEVDVAG